MIYPLKKVITIFLLNIHSDRNAGDYALSRASISQLESSFPNCKIILSINDPESYKGDKPFVYSPFVWIKEENKWQWGKICKFIIGTFIPMLIWRLSRIFYLKFTPDPLKSWITAYIDADIIVSTAGGYQYSSGRGITFLLLNYILFLSHIGGKPLYFLPQSFGPYHYWWEKIITRITCNRSQIIMVREPVSRKNLIDCGVAEKKLIISPDIAFGFTGTSKTEAENWLRELGLDVDSDRPFLGMTIINWGGFYPRFQRQHEYESAIISLIEYFINTINGKVIVLPQTWGPTEAEDDRIIAEKLGRKLTNLNSNFFIITQPIDPEKLQTIFGTMDAVVGTRMHSNIFAMTHGTPALPIGYLHKSVGIAQMLGMGKWVIDINEIDEDLIIRRFSEFWVQRDSIRKSLQETIPQIITDSKRAGKIIADNYFKII